METELTVKLIQSGISIVVGLIALLYRKRLAKEMAEKLKNVYGRLFNIKRVFETKWMDWYLELAFTVFGIGALVFASFSILGPINNW